MRIGNLKLWLGLGVAGMVAAILVLFGTSLNDTPAAEATDGGFDRIEISVGKPAALKNIKKVNTATFECKAPPMGPLAGTQKAALNNQNPEDPATLHHEVWGRTFPQKCTGNINIVLTRLNGMGPLVIKGCTLKNKNSGKNAICDLTNTGTNTWKAAHGQKANFNRIVVEVGKPDKDWKVVKGDQRNTFECQTNGEMVKAEYKDHLKNENPDKPEVRDHEVWSGTFVNKCDGGVQINLVPDPANTAVMVIKACHLQNVGPNGPVTKANCKALRVPSTVAGTEEWKATIVEKKNDGNLAGVSDIVVGSVNSGAGLFYCIVKTDHELPSNAITTYLQCNIDIEGAGVAPTTNTPPSWDDTCDELAARVPPECVPGSLNNPSETGADAIAGPPPPPPYTNLVPQIGRGFYYPGGVGSPGGVCAKDCTVVTSCFQDVGPIKGTGPNIISTAVLLNPKVENSIMADTNGDTVKDTKVDRVSSGTVDIWYNQSNASCDAFAPKGDPDFGGLPLESIQVNDKGGTNINPNPAPWRPGPKPGATTIDFDGDGCTDEAELDPNIFEKCGDDPQNPSDSFDHNTVDLSGVYDILVTVARSDCTNDQCTAEAPGIYFFCRADIQHKPVNKILTGAAFCYVDSVGVDVNSQAYPGITGDGMAGAPPPGPQDANGSYAYGDVNETHTKLTGIFDKNRNWMRLYGCFQTDGVLGNVYADLTVGANQLPGKVDIWVGQDEATCKAGALSGQYVGNPTADPTFNDALVTIWQANPNKGKGYDQDDDGVPTERELQDDIACGRRDPYNKNDYYDVSIPRDGVIDLPNDILGVILHFAPGGYPPGDENWDRPPVMAGVGLGSTWNRGSPDGVIDLPNDILGVILQFNPGGCPPLS